MKSFMTRTLAILMLLAFANPAFAQFGGGLSPGGEKGTVSGTGMVTLEKQPKLMRMQIDLLAKSSSLKEALSALKDRIEAARAQLTVLGADKASIQIGPPQLSTKKTEQQQQIEMMLAQRLRSRGQKNAKKTTTPLTVTAQLTAEWKLAAGSQEELLLAVHPLQNKIEEADLAGIKENSKLSPEEQELLEELGDASSMYGRYGSDDESKPGEPMFTFVSPISEQEHNKALADAFQKAKSRAARLAVAAGSELAGLASVSSTSTQGVDDIDYGRYGYNSALYRAYQSMSSNNDTGENPPEATGVLPQNVKFRISVTAGFELKSKE